MENEDLITLAGNVTAEYNPDCDETDEITLRNGGQYIVLTHAMINKLTKFAQERQARYS